MNRQLRLSTPGQIRERLKELTGKKINIVLRNRKVLFGELQKADEAQLTFVNMRQERISFPWTAISEVYLDSKQ